MKLYPTAILLLFASLLTRSADAQKVLQVTSSSSSSSGGKEQETRRVMEREICSSGTTTTTTTTTTMTTPEATTAKSASAPTFSPIASEEVTASPVFCVNLETVEDAGAGTEQPLESRDEGREGLGPDGVVKDLTPGSLDHNKPGDVDKGGMPKVPGEGDEMEEKMNKVEEMYSGATHHKASSHASLLSPFTHSQRRLSTVLYEISSTAAPYSFLDISQTGTRFLSTDDGTFNFYPLKGPGFPFFDVINTVAHVSTNGFLCFGIQLSSSGANNQCLPDFDKDACIFILHDDIHMGNNIIGGGGVYHHYQSSCDHPLDSSIGCNVFQYHLAEHYAFSSEFDFEALLYDDGRIVLQYGPGEPERGNQATIGIQGYGGEDVYQYACKRENSIRGFLSILFSPYEVPSSSPSDLISGLPSDVPSDSPSRSILPSDRPSSLPSKSSLPSDRPTLLPSTSVLPSDHPSSSPSKTSLPSDRPTLLPSTSISPSDNPSSSPSKSSSPSDSPTLLPSTSSSPSEGPTPLPSTSILPSDNPSFSPSKSSSPSDSPISATTITQPSNNLTTSPMTSSSTSPSSKPSLSSPTTNSPTSSLSSKKSPTPTTSDELELFSYDYND